MSRCAPLCALLSALAACGDAAQLGIADPDAPRAIVNGSRDPMSTYLTEGQVQAVGFLADSRGDEFCSGTLVRPRVVVTARHCVQGRSTDSTFFGFGEQPDDAELLAPVARIHQHPYIDFAILILGVDPARVVEPLTPIDINREVVDRQWLRRWLDAAGFGDTRSRDSGRFFAAVELVDYDAEVVTVDGHGVRGICYGDSGGPVIWQASADTSPLVVGTEQWGDPSCVDRDHLTRLDVVAPFFDEVMAQPLPPAGLPCVDVDVLGACRDGSAVRCAGGYLETDDCSGQGLECGWLGGGVGYGCLPAACGNVDSRGLCAGETALWCEDGLLVSADCAAIGSACAVDEAGAGARCLPCDLCGGVCVDLERSTDHCGACGQACAPAHATGACAQGICTLAACELGWRDADGEVANGCEELLEVIASETLAGGSCAALPARSTAAAAIWVALAAALRLRRPCRRRTARWPGLR